MAFLRIKPNNIECVEDDINEHLTVEDNSITTSHVGKNNETIQCRYEFQKVLKPMSSQSEVFETTTVPSIKQFLSGHDALLFSYGASNSGKSYTMQGVPTAPGIIPRTLYCIFASIGGNDDTNCSFKPSMSSRVDPLDRNEMINLFKEKVAICSSLTVSNNGPHQSISDTSSSELSSLLDSTPTFTDCINPGVVCSVWISFYEIYNENIYDLLTSDNQKFKKPLALAHDRSDDTYYPVGAKQFCVTHWEEAFDLYRYGKKKLHISETALNNKSSRSHCIFSIKLLTRPVDGKSDVGSLRRFVICDLAGTERAEHIRGKGNAMMKESHNINMSLLALSKCFVLLKERQKKQTRQFDSIVIPPFRDSKLTMIFRSFLSGVGHTSMIANISQDIELIFQTQHILKMMAIAHQIRVKTKPFIMPLRPIANAYRKRFSTKYCADGSTPLVSKPRPFGPRPHVSIDVNSTSQSECGIGYPDNVEELKRRLEQEISARAELEAALANLNKKYYHHRSESEADIQEVNKQKRELENNLFKKTREANLDKLKWHDLLMEQKIEMRNIIMELKDAFNIDNVDPTSVVAQAIYIHKDMKQAAFSELQEFKDRVAALENENKQKDEQIAILKGTHFDMQEELELQEMYLTGIWEQQNRPLARSTAIVPQDDQENSQSPIRLNMNTIVLEKNRTPPDYENTPFYHQQISKSTGKKNTKNRKLMDINSTPKSQHPLYSSTVENVRNPAIVAPLSENVTKTLRSGKRV